ncbi:MAG: hypothetical protein KGH90_06385 [Xanthomonadaceae bacterium]|jgi:hypothetical protein|nr:hypothetical protein [Xanthomonadaceae bacterium]
MKKQRLIAGLCCALAFVPATAAWARTAGQATDHQRIEALEARVAALERRLGMSPATPEPPAPHQAAAPAAREAPRAQPAAAAPIAADWSQLHRGMTAREVTAHLGPPDHRQVRPMSEVWYYPGQRQLEFDRNGRLDSWSKH